MPLEIGVGARDRPSPLAGTTPVVDHLLPQALAAPDPDRLPSPRTVTRRTESEDLPRTEHGAFVGHADGSAYTIGSRSPGATNGRFVAAGLLPAAFEVAFVRSEEGFLTDRRDGSSGGHPWLGVR
jgi:hypothetical protein